MGSKQQCRRGGHAAHRYAAYRRPSNHCKNYKKNQIIHGLYISYRPSAKLSPKKCNKDFQTKLPS